VAGRLTDGAEPVVTLATVHRVKGQEWPVVVLVGVAEGLVPHRLTEDVEEERRVLHVGLTRGIERVVVLADEERPSRFLAELDPSVVPPPVPASAPSPVGRAGASRGPGTRPTGRGSGSSPAGVDGSSPGGVDGADPALLERLRAWRGERARRDGVPAYVVLHDKHLQAIAAARPTDARALARVEGMGPRRLELYADEILALVGA
jgi:DNA helicase-2/ATP-dependent DNA helicase PcrA